MEGDLKLIATVIFSFFISCSQQPASQSKVLQPVEAKTSSSANAGKNEENASSKKTSSFSRAEAKDSLKSIEVKADSLVLDMDKVNIKLTQKVKLAENPALPGFEFPLIEMEKQGADFVQILRCVNSYQLETPTGLSLPQARLEARGREQLRGLWNKAFADTVHCRIVGENIIAGKFSDMSLESGIYYYVVNPCVSKLRTISQKDECSFNILATSEFEYEAKLEKAVRDKSRELSAAESQLQGLLGEMGFIIEKFKINLKACEDLIAHERHMLALKKGFVQLGFFIAFTAIGSVFSLNMGIMLGNMVGSMGSQMFMTSVLKWPMTVANTCLDPNYAGSGEKKDGSVTSVTPLYNRMIALLQTDIPQATQRAQVLQEEMSKLNGSYITYNEMVKQATSQGIDLLSKDASTGIPSGIPGFGAGIPADSSAGSE